MSNKNIITKPKSSPFFLRSRLPLPKRSEDDHDDTLIIDATAESISENDAERCSNHHETKEH